MFNKKTKKHTNTTFSYILSTPYPLYVMRIIQRSIRPKGKTRKDNRISIDNLDIFIYQGKFDSKKASNIEI